MRAGRRAASLLPLWLALAIAPWAGVAGEDATRDAIDLADASFAAEDYKRALKLYERAAGDSERRAAAVLGIARSQSRLGRHEKGLATAEAAAAAASSPMEEAAALEVYGVIRARMALDLLVEVENLGTRPGKKKPTYREQLRDHVAASEESLRRALELSEQRLAAAWRSLAELLALVGRLAEARDALVAYFDLEESGRVRASVLLEHLECAADASELKVVREGDEGVVFATKQFSPTPRLSLEIPKGVAPVARAVGVVDTRGYFRCPRILSSPGFGPEQESTFLETLRTWRFQPATLEGQAVAAFYGTTVKLAGRP